MTSLSIPEDTFRELMAHLSAKDVEHVAFLFAQPAGDSGDLRVSELYPVPPSGFEFQSGYHVALTDEVRGRVIKRAWDLGTSLIEAHSHLGEPAAFSHSDLHGFDEWVPHIKWRLPNRPYIALVFAGDAFDALVWDDPAGAAGPLASLRVDRLGSRKPTSITYAKIRGSKR